MEAIKITLETLYDFLRNEKKREDLQKLEETFFVDVVHYLHEKRALLSLKKDENPLFAAGEREKLEYELRSIQRILKELYEKREKKIIDIALNRSKTGSDIINTSAMLREEKEFYQKVLAILDQFRKGILLQLFQGQLPALELVLPKTLDERKDEIRATLLPEKAEDNTTTRIRFLHPTPSFVWKDMKVYGPFERGEATNIFPEVAELLMRKGRAERI